MNQLFASRTDFDKIRRFCQNQNIKLVILDFNGVLDTYHDQKISYITQLLGDSDEYLPELVIEIERAYVSDRTATIEQTFIEFANMHKIHTTHDTTALLAQGMGNSVMSEEAKSFLGSLTIPFVIYTSLSRHQFELAVGSNTYDVLTRDDQVEQKPSVANLRILTKQYDVKPHEVCVVGDGLVDDLLPASLLGMRTLLVSPFVDDLVNLSK